MKLVLSQTNGDNLTARSRGGAAASMITQKRRHAAEFSKLDVKVDTSETAHRPTQSSRRVTFFAHSWGAEDSPKKCIPRMIMMTG